MKVKAIKNILRDEEASDYNRNFCQMPTISIDKDYIVLDIDIKMNSKSKALSVFFGIFDDTNTYRTYSSKFFEIIDTKISRYWNIDIYEYGIYFAPEEFFKTTIIDAMDDGVENATERFKQIYNLLVTEYEED